MIDPKIARRALFAGAAALTCALLAARLAASSIAASGDVPDLGLYRLRQLLSALPGIAGVPGTKCVVLGSSAVIIGFSPEEFDERMNAEGIPLVSFNLGVNSPSPLILRLLTARLRAVFQENPARLGLSIIEFSPSDSTLAAESGHARPHAVDRALLTGWKELPGVLLESPKAAGEIAGIKALGAGVGAQELTAVLRRRLHLNPDLPPLPSDALQDKLFETIAEIPSERDLARWDGRHRGGRRLLLPATREAYAAFARASASAPEKSSGRRDFIDSSDIIELHLSDKMIAEFIRAVKNLQAVSDRTYVLVAPRDPVWIPPTPDGEARLRRALSRIKEETGAEILDFYSDGEFQTSDFVDVAHVNESSGRPKLMKALAQRTAGLMRAAENGAAGSRLP